MSNRSQCTDASSHSRAHTERLGNHAHVHWAKQQIHRHRDQRRQRSAYGEHTLQGTDAHAHAHARSRRTFKPNDALYVDGSAWHLEQSNRHDINVFPVWDQCITGKGVVVTIVDDGIEHDHPDLRSNYDPMASTDMNGHDKNPYPDRSKSINRHGTRCSGVVGASHNSVCSLGVAYNANQTQIITSLPFFKMAPTSEFEMCFASSIDGCWRAKHVSNPE